MQEVPGRDRVVVLVEGVVYQGSAVQLLDLIRRAPPGARTLLIVGHDSALPDLALMLRQLLRLPGRRERCRTA